MAKANGAELTAAPLVRAEDLLPAAHRFFEEFIVSAWRALAHCHRRAIARVSVHVGPQYGVDPCLIAPFATEPIEKISIQPHRHGFLRSRHDDTRIPPESLVCGPCIGVIDYRGMYFLVCHRAKPPPFGFGLTLRGG